MNLAIEPKKDPNILRGLEKKRKIKEVFGIISNWIGKGEKEKPERKFGRMKKEKEETNISKVINSLFNQGKINSEEDFLKKIEELREKYSLDEIAQGLNNFFNETEIKLNINLRKQNIQRILNYTNYQKTSFEEYCEIDLKNLIVKIPKNFDGVTSYTDLESVLDEKYGSFSENKQIQYSKKLYSFLEKLDNFLSRNCKNEINSIEYLYYLKEIRGFSFKDISSLLEKNGIEIKARTLAQYFKDYFLWKSKGKNDSSPAKKLKDQEKMWERRKFLKEERERKSEELKNSWLKEQKSVDLSSLEIYGNIKEKTKQIFDILAIIKKEEFEKKILELRKKYSVETITLAINKILKENNFDFHFSRNRIYEIK